MMRHIYRPLKLCCCAASLWSLKFHDSWGVKAAEAPRHAEGLGVVECWLCFPACSNCLPCPASLGQQCTRLVTLMTSHVLIGIWWWREHRQPSSQIWSACGTSLAGRLWSWGSWLAGRNVQHAKHTRTAVLDGGSR
eukprot:jgi/Botrbrau1/22114/Bobra.0206s0040.2